MMPAMMLSGMLFDIAAMPRWLQLVTYVVPARYLVSILQTLFLAGDVWAVVLPNLAGLGVAAVLAVSATHGRDTAQARLMLRRILALIVKELVGLWKDPKTRVVILVPPLVQVVIFAYAATYDVTHVPLGIWNDDAGTQSAELVRRFAASPAFDVVASFASPAEARAALDAKQVAVVLRCAAGFLRRCARRPHRPGAASARCPTIELRADGARLRRRHRAATSRRSCIRAAVRRSCC